MTTGVHGMRSTTGVEAGNNTHRQVFVWTDMKKKGGVDGDRCGMVWCGTGKEQT